MAERTWTIKTSKQSNGKTRALCGVKGCPEYREHAEKNMAAQFVMGHMVAKHREDGVNASDTFSVK